MFISLIKSIKRVRWCGCVMFNLIIPFVFLVPLIAIGQPVPEKGFLDASGIDFKAEKSIPLTGEWEFYWKELVKPDEFDRKDKNFTYFPQLWNDIEGVKPTGYATYRLRIQLGDNPPDLALRLPDFYTAYELYANGEKVGSNGKVGTSKEEYKPFWLDQVVSVHPDSAGKLNIVLHIANFEHSKGGPKESILFGSEEYLRSQQSKEFYYAFFLAGCLLMGGLFFLGLYLFGRHDKSILYFSLFCIIYSYRMAGFQIYPLHSVLDLPWIITLHFEYLSMFLAVTFFNEYTRYLYPQEIHVWFIRIITGTAVLFALITLLFPPTVFTKLVEPFTIILPIFIFYAALVYFRAAIKKRPGAPFALASTLVIFIIFLYDMMTYYGIMSLNLIVTLSGYIIFFFLQSLILSYRFAHFLKVARERAEQASRAKSQFLSTMSHEIRTPLNAVIGLSGLLNQTRLTEEQAEYAKTIRISGESLLNIINNILDYSKIESGKLELEKTSIRLISLVEDVVDLLSPLSSEKELELVYLIEDEVPEVIESDAARIQQVLVNLIGNAIKFTNKGEVFLHISCNRKNAIKGNILFEVQDTGIGIPENKINKLFQSFSQLDASTTRQHGGTGLGLAISKKLVQVLGGEIWVESEPEVGTTFYFTIEAEEIASTQEQPKYLGLKNKRAFILDDNLTNLNILEKNLQKANIKVSSFSDPVTFLDSTDTFNEYDFGILDMQMPKLDGIQVAKKLRKYRDKEELPVALLSSIHMLGDIKNHNLFNIKLTKPVRQSLFLDHIERMLSGRSHQQRWLQDEKPLSSTKKDLKILVAEDNLINQRVATKILERLGYTTDVAQDGKEAIKMTRKIPYDLIFMDMNMPVMDGVEATKKLRNEENRLKKNPVIIAMTANAMKEDKDKCLQAGMDDFIAKPVTIHETRELIDKWFHL